MQRGFFPSLLKPSEWMEIQEDSVGTQKLVSPQSILSSLGNCSPSSPFPQPQTLGERTTLLTVVLGHNRVGSTW